MAFLSDLVPRWLRGISEHPGLGLAHKVAVGVHLKRAVEI